MQKRFTVVPAVYVILRSGDKIFLIRRAGTGYRDGYYGLPSGHIEGGEPAIRAAAREAKEETGVDIAESDLRFVHVVHRLAEEGDHERVDFFFQTTVWQGEPKNCEPHKCDDAQWFFLEDLPAETIPLLRSVLSKVAVGEPYSDENF